MIWFVRTNKDLQCRPLIMHCIYLTELFFHGANTGSNPVGDAKSFQQLTVSPPFCSGDTLGTQTFG
jgi:hypothetical protein